MSFNSFITRSCKQPVVYWGSPVKDGYGGSSFADPVELKARWENLDEVIITKEGREIVSKSRVWVLQDVQEQGYLYLGLLDDLDSDPCDPREIDGANEIIAFRKLPILGSTTEFTRRASLLITGSQNV